jgi:hypothetical protein
VADKNRNLFLTILEAGEFKIQVLTDLVSGEAQVVVCRRYLVPGFTRGRQGRTTLYSLIHEGSVPMT